MAILLKLLEGVHAILANMANGDPRLFGVFVRHLDHFLPPLGVELGNGDAQQLAFHDRIEAEIGVANGAVYGVDQRLVPDLD